MVNINLGNTAHPFPDPANLPKKMLRLSEVTLQISHSFNSNRFLSSF